MSGSTPQRASPVAGTETRANRHGRISADAVEHEARLTLDGSGMICDCNRAGEVLFGYRRSELVWRPIALLLPDLAEWQLLAGGQPNRKLRFLCRIGRRFHGVTKDGERIACELCLNLIDEKAHGGRGGLSLIVTPVETASNPSNLLATEA